MIMSLTCLTCRKSVENVDSIPQGNCPNCGGELAGEEGAWLQWSGPDGDGLTMLSGNRLVIGRRSGNDLVFKDAKVSKLHASLHSEGNRWYIRDICSNNGTFVNSRRIAETRLKDGDSIMLGQTEIEFHTKGVPSGVGGITIVPVPEHEENVLACLKLVQSDFNPESEIEDDKTLRADYERLRIVHLFNSYMGEERDEEALVKNILSFAFELLPADRGAILLKEGEDRPLTPAVTYHRDSFSGEINIPDSILRRAVQNREAILSGDAMQDLRFQDSVSVVREKVRSAMCVPLIGQDELLGVVHLDTKERLGAFSFKDLQLLSTIAGRAANVIMRHRLQVQLEQEKETQRRLARFLSPEVLKEVVDRRIDLSKQAQTGRVTVLFCDIRGFSAIAESMEATQLVRMLNAFFERMVDVVFRHEGVLDKFIGDALMAVWGVPFSKPDNASRAVTAAKEMLDAVRRFNQSSRQQGWPELEIGIGVNTGEAVIGTVGSSIRMEYTVMGDAVNLASRICSMAQGGQVLISEDTYNEAECDLDETQRFKNLPPVKVRGRKSYVNICKLIRN
jgi:adenylate cyclase